jgi:ABC-type branched-subunit amino acid transport system permease subunit
MAQMNEAFGDEMASALSTFWADVLVLIIAALAAFVTLHYMRSKIGYALTALREDEDAAKVMGINVTKYKIIAFITAFDIFFVGFCKVSSISLLLLPIKLDYFPLRDQS